MQRPFEGSDGESEVLVGRKTSQPLFRVAFLGPLGSEQAARLQAISMNKTDNERLFWPPTDFEKCAQIL